MKKNYFNILFTCLGIWAGGQTTTEGYGFYEEPYDLGYNVPFQSVTDNSGYTYLTGTSSNEDAPQSNIFTIKVSPDGEIIWEVREPTLDFVLVIGYTITLDADNNPIVSGTHWNGQDMDIKTVKYDGQDGTTIWSSVFDGGYGGLDYPKAVTTDMEGNIIVAGYSYYGSNSIGYSIIKYDPQGNLLWSTIAENEVAGTTSKPSGIAIDSNGNIGITGIDVASSGFSRYYTVKYAANGDLLWKQSHLHSVDG